MKKKASLSAGLILLLAFTIDAQQMEGFSLHLTPGMNLPLATATELYTIGGGAEIVGAYSLPFLPWLFGRVSIDYSLTPTRSVNNLSLYTFAGGVGVGFDPFPKFNIQAAVTGGYGLGVYTGEVGGSAYVAGEAGVYYFITPMIGLGAGTSYRHYFSKPTTFYQGLKVNIGMSLRLWAGSRKANIEILDIYLNPLFPVFYKHYDDNPVGNVIIRNGENAPINDVKASFFVSQYMDRPKEYLFAKEIGKGEEISVPLYALFTDSILEITEGTKVTAEIKFAYTYADGELELARAETVRMYDRNAMTWDDDRKAAAFITAKDPAILEFSKNVAGTVRKVGTNAVNINFRTALAMFESLKLFGINYVIDPKTPYNELSQNAAALDYLQFPRQTLTYKAGDCDDLSILNAALLESIGIESAFITVPGHIFIAFALDLSPGDAYRIFGDTNNLIAKEENTWVPLEITMVQDGFLQAWETGAKEWREAEAAGTAAFYPVHEAWETYEPVGLSGPAAITSLSSSDIISRYQSALNTFVERQISPQVTVLQNRIKESNDHPKLINTLGVLYARYGILEKAKVEFESAADKDYPPAIVNLGNIYFLHEEYEKALEYFEHADRVAPDNPTVLLGLAKAHYELENFCMVQRAYTKIEEKDPQLADKYSYLVSRELDSTRASSAAIRETVVWDEEQVESTEAK